MKHENNGKLFDIAFKKLKIGSCDKTLLIDDSAKACKFFENRGGETFLYENYEKFESWMKKYYQKCK